MRIIENIQFDNQIEGRYDRHELISWWDQKKVSHTRILVAGAGALGNEVLKLLALIGVGHITIVDFDVISPSNLARMVLFREGDVGRSKVEVAIERLHEINPEVELVGIQGDLRFDIGLGSYQSMDVVFGCLDSVNARWAMNRKCMQAGVSWIDGGISDYHGLVVHYSPKGGACYECNFTAKTIERFNRRYSCPYGLVSTQGEEKVPTTAVTTSLIASIQVQQALLMLHGLDDECLQPGERLMVFLKPFGMIKDRLPYNPECLAHDLLPDQILLVEHSNEITAGEAIALAHQNNPKVESLALPFDLVTEFRCQVCGTIKAVNRPKEKVYQTEIACPRCGQMREPVFISIITQLQPQANLQLRQLGIPPQEILIFNTPDQRVFLRIK